MKWKNNKLYPNILQSIANNEADYISLAQGLCKPQKVLQGFSCEQWFEDEIIIDDWDKWHYLFETEESDDYDIEFFTDPLLYNKGIKLKPNEEEYPVVVTYNSGSYDKDIVYWSSIKELSDIK